MAGPGIALPIGTFQLFEGVVTTGACGVVVLTGGCSGPNGALTVPGLDAGTAIKPLAAALAIAGSFEFLGSSDGSGSIPGFSGGDAGRSCVTLLFGGSAKNCCVCGRGAAAGVEGRVAVVVITAMRS